MDEVRAEDYRVTIWMDRHGFYHARTSFDDSWNADDLDFKSLTDYLYELYDEEGTFDVSAEQLRKRRG